MCTYNLFKIKSFLCTILLPQRSILWGKSNSNYSLATTFKFNPRYETKNITYHFRHIYGTGSEIAKKHTTIFGYNSQKEASGHNHSRRRHGAVCHALCHASIEKGYGREFCLILWLLYGERSGFIVYYSEERVLPYIGYFGMCAGQGTSFFLFQQRVTLSYLDGYKYPVKW